MRKPRSDSKLKTLPEDRQRQIIEWIETPKSETSPGGLQLALEQLAADGITTSLAALSEFRSWWQLQRDFEEAESHAREVQDLLKNADAKFTNEQIEAAGFLIFTKEALKHRDAEGFREMQYLKLAKESALTKGRQKEEELQIKRLTFQRETCSLFLKWFADETARQIATGAGTNAEKIEALGQAMFGEDW